MADEKVYTTYAINVDKFLTSHTYRKSIIAAVPNIVKYYCGKGDQHESSGADCKCYFEGWKAAMEAVNAGRVCPLCELEDAIEECKNMPSSNNSNEDSEARVTSITVLCGHEEKKSEKSTATVEESSETGAMKNDETKNAPIDNEE